MRAFARIARAFGTFAAVAALFSPLVSRAARAAGKQVTFEEYQKLDDATRKAMIRRYVRRTARGEWEVLLRSYHIRTDISDEATLALAVKMDEFYAGFKSIFKGSFRIRLRPELWAMKDKTTYRRAISRWSSGRMNTPPWSAGCFATHGNKYALFGCNEWGDEKMHGTLFHEGTHHLMHFYIGRKFPRWFDEGVATNFQDWDVSLSAERNIYKSVWKSRWPGYLYRMLKGEKGGDGKGLPKPDLIKLMSSSDREWLNPVGDPGPLYAQAWGFVNFLLSSGPSGQKNVNTIIDSSRRGVEFQKVAPIPIRVALAGQYQDYLDGVIVPHIEYSMAVAELVKAGNLGDAAVMVDEGLKEHAKSFELLYYKGLLALEGGKAAEAYEILRPLAKRKPRHPRLFRALGRAALEAGDKPKARNWLRKALREDCRDEEVRELLKK